MMPVVLSIPDTQYSILFPMPSPLFILTGLSGAGKSTVADALMQDASLGLNRFVTTTTRARRPGEENGVHYWFVSKEDFEAKREQGGFYEWAEVYGNLYGPSKEEMTRLMATGQPILLVVDVQGAKTFKTIHPEARVIFLTAAREDLLRRLQSRGSAPEEVEKRMNHINEELQYQEIADALIENQDGDLEKTIEAVKTFIRQAVR